MSYLKIYRDEAAAPLPCESKVNKLMEPAVVFAVVVMAILAGTMSVVGVERLIRGRFTLFSMVRFLLRFSFVLTLPLLSSMSRDPVNGDRVLFVILWLLLIELIRKKVSGMVRSSSDGGGGFSRATGGRFRLMGHSDEGTRLVWIGYLIYSNAYYSKVTSSGTQHEDDDDDMKKVVAMFTVLWSLVLAKLLQRVFNEWKAQDSLTAGGNTHLIAGYMQHVVDKEDQDGCKYVVMGEEKLVVHTAASMTNKKKRHENVKDVVTITTRGCGYGVGRYPNQQSEQKHVNLLVDMAKSGELITVDDITKKIRVPHWCCCFTGSRFTDHMHHLCFSFSFFKLLRRRFEHYPMVEAGSRATRQLMLDQLLSKGPNKTFRVIRQELDFLDCYYDAGSPVAMSSPWLFILNYFFSLVFASTYLAAVIIVLLEVKGRLHGDNHFLHPSLYAAVSILLVVTLIAIEFTELLTSYILSNWFMVHLLCLLAASGGGRIWRWACKPAIRLFIAGRFLLFYSFQCMLFLSCRGTNVDTINLKQVSILRVCEPVHKLLSWSSQVKLPTEGEAAIVKELEEVVRHSLDGEDAMVSMHEMVSSLGLKKGADTATQVILACHLATELLEMKHVVMVDKKMKKTKKKKMTRDEQRGHDVALALSRYCMYLVARSPELLPDNERWVADRYSDMKAFLEEASSRRCCCCCCSCRLWKCGCWRTVLMDMDAGDVGDPAAKAGLTLFRKLDAAASSWKDLADFWVKMVVYLAPSNDVEGHAMALADNGADLVTYLWAFCTHTGIIRQPRDEAPEQHHQV
uniref:DUF4220 domain-containing protein n=1 Tax=Leersia perrieri TaxID=77586 RepID=A0A0D9W3G9_9ORYZ